MRDTKAPKTKQPLDPESESWHKLPWRTFEQHVYRIQKRMCAMRRIEISLV
jgi:RNA-directed DNA polymerase